MPKIYVSRRIELEIACGVRVGQRRKFAGSMWKKPEVLDRKSGADKWCESASNAKLLKDNPNRESVIIVTVGAL